MNWSLAFKEAMPNTSKDSTNLIKFRLKDEEDIT